MRFFSRLLGKAPAPDRAVQTPTPKAPEPERPPAEPFADIDRLAFGPRLLELAFDPAHAEQRRAQKRIAELIDARTLSIDALPTEPEHRASVLAIAAATTDTANFDGLAGRIADTSVWLDLAVHAPTAKLRQLAAARLEALDDLRAVMKAARERDKNVYRIAKAKVDEINAAAKRVEEAKAHMHSLADTIERHSYKPFDGAYVATIDHLERDWRSLTIEIPEDLRARVNAAIDRAREAITEHIRAAGMQAAHEAAVANAEPLRAATVDELKKLLAALYVAESFDPATATNVGERVTKLAERWDGTLHYKAASGAETREWSDARHAVQRLVRAYGEAGTLSQQLQAARTSPGDAAMTRLQRLVADRHVLGENAPAIVVEAQAEAKGWLDAQAAQRAAVDDAERQLGQLIRKAQHALAAGRSRQAFGMRRSIEAKLANLPQCPKPLAERLQQLDTKLAELQDWRSFAVTPKRSELIEQMQALIGSDEDPVQLAEEIKRLQEEWKALAKGGADSDADWEKFHEAAQAAYAPCKAHFEAQSQARERNLERRKALVARLAEYERSTDWSSVEWKHVVNALRAAKQEWRSSGPTERVATKPLEKQFDALIASVQARLDAEYSANLERKRVLVDQAQRLAAVEDVAQAASEVKRLQSAWRAVGVTPQAEGQRLWDEFKQHCDAVFDKRRKEHTDRMAEIEQNEERALAVCIELEDLARRTGAELYASAQRVRELRDAFAQIGELPRDKSREIQHRFRRAVEQFEHALVRERDREASQAWTNLFDAANRIRIQQLDPAADAAALRRSIDAIEHWPKGGKQAIEQKLARAVDGDLKTNAAALRSIVIRAEIAAGAATPEADQTQRRTIQLQALVKGVGRGTPAPREQLEALAFEWVAVGPVAADIQDELFARFQRAWNLTR